MELFPSFTIKNPVNLLEANSILFCQSSPVCDPRTIFKTNFIYLFLSKLIHSVKLALLFSGSVFSITISVVVRQCTNKKMVRPNTRGVVALMTNNHTIGDRAEVNNPREPMGRDVGAINAKAPVSKPRFKRKPLPAMLGLFNFSPEAFFIRFIAPSFSHYQFCIMGGE